MSDDYRIVSARLMGVRPNAIFVDHPHRQSVVSIPRSLLHGVDDLKIDQLNSLAIGREHTFRLREWKAEELGL